MTLDPGTADQLRAALATVAAIPVTPFGADGQGDWDAQGRVIRRMVDAGVRLITPSWRCRCWSRCAAATWPGP
jgi:hypothetical protein